MKKIMGLTIITAFCSIIYELLLASSLSLLTGSHIWWYSWTIAFYISGLALGSYRASQKVSDTTFVKVELGLAALGVTSLFWVMLSHWLLYVVEVHNFHVDFDQAGHYTTLIKYIFFGITQSLVLAIGTLSGYEIPLLIREMKKQTGLEQENRVIALNYLGTLLGTVVFTFGFYPHLELITIGVVVGLLNLAICFWLTPSIRQISLAAGSIFLVALGLFTYKTDLEQFYLKTRYFLADYLIHDVGNEVSFLTDQQKIRKVERLKSLYQHIDLVKELDPASEDVKMFLDSNFQLSTASEKTYHESFAHVSLNLTNHIPKKVLVLGAGDGMLIRELLKYPSVESITQVELDDTVLKLFSNPPLNKYNDNSLSNPKVHTQIGDGFYFVRNTHEKFDSIYIDFPYPKTYDLARLYSVEFYENVKRVLLPGGIAVMDVPLESKLMYMLKVNDNHSDADFDPEMVRNNDIMLSTLFFAGFRSMFPYYLHNESFLVMTPDQIKANYQPTAEFLAHTTVIQGSDLEKLSEQKFPYTIDKKSVNSIFFPRLVHEWKLAPMY